MIPLYCILDPSFIKLFSLDFLDSVALLGAKDDEDTIEEDDLENIRTESEANQAFNSQYRLG